MTYKAFYNKVISLIPSGDLRVAAKSGKHVFTDTDLLKFINNYAPSFDKKIEFFDMAADVFTDKETKYHARKLAEHCRKMYDCLVEHSDDAVYSIGIISSLAPDGYERMFAAKTFEEALETVETCARQDRKYKCDNEEYSYEIKKLSVLCARSIRDLDKTGELCSCKWDPIFGIVDIDAWRLKNEFGVDCGTCKRKHVCLQSHDIVYPAFLQPYDLVAYKTDKFKPVAFGEYGYPDRYSNIAYGVLCCDMTRDDNNALSYVIALDSRYIKERRADERTASGNYLVYSDHDHPSYAELFKPERRDVPDDVYSDYLYAAEELKKIGMLVNNIMAAGHSIDEGMSRIHYMHLAEQPYRLIESGKKTVEVRLYDERRKSIKRYDTIIFSRGEACEDTLAVCVNGVRRFASFAELMQSDLFDRTGSDGLTPEEAALSMYKYYTPEQEKQYGVLAIEIEVIKNSELRIKNSELRIKN